MMPSSSLEWIHTKEPVSYDAALAFMKSRVLEIHQAQASECIWHLEHPSLYTSGTGSSLYDDLKDPKKPLPFPLYPTGRGGRLTYHGPGQDIFYCIINLKKHFVPLDLKQFIKVLEQWVIEALKKINVVGVRREGLIGVWTQDFSGEFVKIAALGIRIRHWVSFHGIALNRNVTLSHYDPIIPCGLKSDKVTSLKELGFLLSSDEVDSLLRQTCPF